MANKCTYKVPFRRRRTGKTNYNKRLALLKSEQPRLTARASANNFVTQIIEYHAKGDNTLSNATAIELKKFGYKGHTGNVCAAYLTGILIGSKAKQKNIKTAVFDLGLRTPTQGANVFAILKGAVEAGLDIPHDPKKLPSDERVHGQHIEAKTGTKLHVDKIKEEIMKKKW